MREIKFRVWNSVLNEYRKLDMNSGEQNLGMGFEVMGGINSNITTIYHSVGDVIEQYTGLKDVNGVEIYEGDIVEGGIEGRRSLIEMSSYEWLKQALEDEFNKTYCNYKIIGNKFENPELLEEKK